MRILIIYHLRLGDIARCLPIAKHFHDQGHEVDFECLPEYHNLFELVPYCRPITPENKHGQYDRILDLQIWPNRFDEFTASGLNWMDFVYGLVPEGRDIDRQIVLDSPAIVTPPVLRDCLLAFPTGYSQAAPINPLEVLHIAHRLNAPVLAIGKAEHGFLELQSIEELCAWIRDAKMVLTINTSASILASALRKQWIHIADMPAHDWRHPNQVRIERQF